MLYVSDLFIIGFTYFFITAFENTLHKASHHKISGPLYRWHRLHHIDYPSTRTESDVYINTSGFHNYFLYCILSTLFVVYLVSSNRTFTIFSVQVIIYTVSVNHLHKQFHLTNSKYKKYKWFQKYKRNHLLHHTYLQTNFNFYDLTFDKLQNSYFSDKERLRMVASNS